MTAQGKISASKVQVNDRIIVKTFRDAEGDGVHESRTKTGDDVQVARVIGKTKCSNARGYMILTTAGAFYAEPVQTMWLAPEDAAGIKRAHIEALTENEVRDAYPVAEDEAAKDEERWTNGAIIDAEEQAYAEDEERTQRAALQDEARRVEQAVIAAEESYRESEAALAEQAAVHAAWVETMAAAAPGLVRVTNVGGKPAGLVEIEEVSGHLMFGTLIEEAETAAPVEMGPIDKAAITAKRIDSLMNSGTRTETGSTVVSLLEKVWARIREDHPELPDVVIITGSGLVGASKWGHFRSDGWKLGGEGPVMLRHELFLAGEALAKGAEQVLQTMLHEGAHTLAKVRGQQDTSRQGRWHNKIFCKTAVEMGLHHAAETADKVSGYSFVTLTQETRERYADLIAELNREIALTCHLPSWLGGEADGGGEKITGKPAGGSAGSTTTNVKLTCRCEEPNIIRASKKVAVKMVVRCEDCDSPFRDRG